MTVMENAWLHFRHTLPKDVPLRELHEIKRAFLAGASVMLLAINVAIDETDTDEDGVRAVDRLYADLKEMQQRG